MSRPVPLTPLLRYEILWKEGESPCYIYANSVEKVGEVLFLDVVYSDEDHETVGIFNEWVYIISSPVSFSRILPDLFEYSKTPNFPKDWGKVDGKEF